MSQLRRKKSHSSWAKKSNTNAPRSTSTKRTLPSNLHEFRGVDLERAVVWYDKNEFGSFPTEGAFLQFMRSRVETERFLLSDTPIDIMRLSTFISCSKDTSYYCAYKLFESSSGFIPTKLSTASPIYGGDRKTNNDRADVMASIFSGVNCGQNPKGGSTLKEHAYEICADYLSATLLKGELLSSHGKTDGVDTMAVVSIGGCMCTHGGLVGEEPSFSWTPSDTSGSTDRKCCLRYYFDYSLPSILENKKVMNFMSCMLHPSDTEVPSDPVRVFLKQRNRCTLAREGQDFSFYPRHENQLCKKAGKILAQESDQHFSATSLKKTELVIEEWYQNFFPFVEDDSPANVEDSRENCIQSRTGALFSKSDLKALAEHRSLPGNSKDGYVVTLKFLLASVDQMVVFENIFQVLEPSEITRGSEEEKSNYATEPRAREFLPRLIKMERIYPYSSVASCFFRALVVHLDFSKVSHLKYDHPEPEYRVPMMRDLEKEKEKEERLRMMGEAEGEDEKKKGESEDSVGDDGWDEMGLKSEVNKLVSDGILAKRMVEAANNTNSLRPMASSLAESVAAISDVIDDQEISSKRDPVPYDTEMIKSVEYLTPPGLPPRIITYSEDILDVHLQWKHAVEVTGRGGFRGTMGNDKPGIFIVDGDYGQTSPPPDLGGVSDQILMKKIWGRRASVRSILSFFAAECNEWVSFMIEARKRFTTLRNRKELDSGVSGSYRFQINPVMYALHFFVAVAVYNSGMEMWKPMTKIFLKQEVEEECCTKPYAKGPSSLDVAAETIDHHCPIYIPYPLTSNSIMKLKLENAREPLFFRGRTGLRTDICMDNPNFSLQFSGFCDVPLSCTRDDYESDDDTDVREIIFNKDFCNCLRHKSGIKSFFHKSFKLLEQWKTRATSQELSVSWNIIDQPTENSGMNQCFDSVGFWIATYIKYVINGFNTVTNYHLNTLAHATHFLSVNKETIFARQAKIYYQFMLASCGYVPKIKWGVARIGYIRGIVGHKMQFEPVGLVSDETGQPCSFENIIMNGFTLYDAAKYISVVAAASGRILSPTSKEEKLSKNLDVLFISPAKRNSIPRRMLRSGHYWNNYESYYPSYGHDRDLYLDQTIPSPKAACDEERYVTCEKTHQCMFSSGFETDDFRPSVKTEDLFQKTWTGKLHPRFPNPFLKSYTRKWCQFITSVSADISPSTTMQASGSGRSGLLNQVEDEGVSFHHSGCYLDITFFLVTNYEGGGLSPVAVSHLRSMQCIDYPHLYRNNTSVAQAEMVDTMINSLLSSEDSLLIRNRVWNTVVSGHASFDLTSGVIRDDIWWDRKDLILDCEDLKRSKEIVAEYHCDLEETIQQDERILRKTGGRKGSPFLEKHWKTSGGFASSGAFSLDDTERFMKKRRLEEIEGISAKTSIGATSVLDDTIGVEETGTAAASVILRLNAKERSFSSVVSAHIRDESREMKKSDVIQYARETHMSPSFSDFHTLIDPAKHLFDRTKYVGSLTEVVSWSPDMLSTLAEDVTRFFKRTGAPPFAGLINCPTFYDTDVLESGYYTKFYSLISDLMERGIDSPSSIPKTAELVDEKFSGYHKHLKVANLESLKRRSILNYLLSTSREPSFFSHGERALIMKEFLVPRATTTLWSPHSKPQGDYLPEMAYPTGSTKNGIYKGSGFDLSTAIRLFNFSDSSMSGIMQCLIPIELFDGVNLVNTIVVLEKCLPDQHEIQFPFGFMEAMLKQEILFIRQLEQSLFGDEFGLILHAHARLDRTLYNKFFHHSVSGQGVSILGKILSAVSEVPFADGRDISLTDLSPSLLFAKFFLSHRVNYLKEQIEKLRLIETENGSRLLFYRDYITNARGSWRKFASMLRENHDYLVAGQPRGPIGVGAYDEYLMMLESRGSCRADGGESLELHTRKRKMTALGPFSGKHVIMQRYLGLSKSANRQGGILVKHRLSNPMSHNSSLLGFLSSRGALQGINSGTRSFYSNIPHSVLVFYSEPSGDRSIKGRDAPLGIISFQSILHRAFHYSLVPKYNDTDARRSIAHSYRNFAQCYIDKVLGKKKERSSSVTIGGCRYDDMHNFITAVSGGRIPVREGGVETYDSHPMAAAFGEMGRFLEVIAQGSIGNVDLVGSGNGHDSDNGVDYSSNNASVVSVHGYNERLADTDDQIPGVSTVQSDDERYSNISDEERDEERGNGEASGNAEGQSNEEWPIANIPPPEQKTRKEELGWHDEQFQLLDDCLIKFINPRVATSRPLSRVGGMYDHHRHPQADGSVDGQFKNSDSMESYCHPRNPAFFYDLRLNDRTSSRYLCVSIPRNPDDLHACRAYVYDFCTFVDMMIKASIPSAAPDCGSSYVDFSLSHPWLGESPLNGINSGELNENVRYSGIAGYPADGFSPYQFFDSVKMVEIKKGYQDARAQLDRRKDRLLPGGEDRSELFTKVSGIVMHTIRNIEFCAVKSMPEGSSDHMSDSVDNCNCLKDYEPLIYAKSQYSGWSVGEGITRAALTEFFRILMDPRYGFSVNCTATSEFPAPGKSESGDMEEFSIPASIFVFHPDIMKLMEGDTCSCDCGEGGGKSEGESNEDDMEIEGEGGSKEKEKEEKEANELPEASSPDDATENNQYCPQDYPGSTRVIRLSKHIIEKLKEKEILAVISCYALSHPTKSFCAHNTGPRYLPQILPIMLAWAMMHGMTLPAKFHPYLFGFGGELLGIRPEIVTCTAQLDIETRIVESNKRITERLLDRSTTEVMLENIKVQRQTFIEENMIIPRQTSTNPIALLYDRMIFSYPENRALAEESLKNYMQTFGNVVFNDMPRMEYEIRTLDLTVKADRIKKEALMDAYKVSRDFTSPETMKNFLDRKTHSSPSFHSFITAMTLRNISLTELVNLLIHTNYPQMESTLCSNWKRCNKDMNSTLCNCTGRTTDCTTTRVACITHLCNWYVHWGQKFPFFLAKVFVPSSSLTLNTLGSFAVSSGLSTATHEGPKRTHSTDIIDDVTAEKNRKILATKVADLLTITIRVKASSRQTIYMPETHIDLTRAEGGSASDELEGSRDGDGDGDDAVTIEDMTNEEDASSLAEDLVYAKRLSLYETIDMESAHNVVAATVMLPHEHQVYTLTGRYIHGDSALAIERRRGDSDFNLIESATVSNPIPLCSDRSAGPQVFIHRQYMHSVTRIRCAYRTLKTMTEPNRLKLWEVYAAKMREEGDSVITIQAMSNERMIDGEKPPQWILETLYGRLYGSYINSIYHWIFNHATAVQLKNLVTSITNLASLSAMSVFSIVLDGKYEPIDEKRVLNPDTVLPVEKITCVSQMIIDVYECVKKQRSNRGYPRVRKEEIDPEVAERFMLTTLQVVSGFYDKTITTTFTNT